MLYCLIKFDVWIFFYQRSQALWKARKQDIRPDNCEAIAGERYFFVRKMREGMLFVQYPKCFTCQKARKWLEAHKITYTDRHIAEDNPSYDELKQWYEKSGLPLKRFFNTSGVLYKEMQLKDRLPAMSEEEQLRLLATNGMLVKRPILVDGDRVLVGFKEAEWPNDPA